jgi:hypothetical protein
MSKKIKIENVRLSYPNLFQKGFYEGKENKKYTATLVLDKSNPKHVAAKKLIDEQIETIYKETKTKRIDFKEDKFCVKEESADFENSWLIKVGNSKRPTIIDRDKSPLAESDEKIYAGCYVNVIIDFYYYDKQYGKFILSNLYGVQFSEDGEPFGTGPVDVTDEFDDIDL